MSIVRDKYDYCHIEQNATIARNTELKKIL